MTDTIDYAAKGREVARMAIRGAYDKPTPKPAIEYIRLVGIDPTKMTEAQAKELHDAYREAINR